MSKLSEDNIKKIKEEILSLLYHNNLKAMFTNSISQELIRDEEFVKRLLLELKNEDLVIEVKKSHKGAEYSRRRRWQLSPKALEAYKGLIEQ